MAVRRVDFVSWFLRLLGWDALLPVCVVLVPTAVGFLLPNNPGAIEVTALVLPITAFLIRLFVGKRDIAKNNCAIAFRRFQFCVFCVGIFVLVLIDAVLILSHVMPKGGPFATTTDCLVFLILFSIYLTSMAIAMYPGASEIVS